MKKQTISVVLATFNEEENLSGCLESVKNFADEIIVVDGTSKDKTVEIAKNFGAKVVVTENPPIFHINKQKAIDLSLKDWVLQLDADERVSLQGKNEILKTINSENAKNGYWLPRKNWFLGRFLMKGGVYPDYTLRLYKNGKGRLPMKDVHEQAVVDGEVGFLTEPLIHMADPYFGRYLMRFSRYTNLISAEYKEKNVGKDPISVIKYLFFLPTYWFILAYIRHKGFMDGWQGFVFAFFSASRFPVAYIKYLAKQK